MACLCSQQHGAWLMPAFNQRCEKGNFFGHQRRLCLGDAMFGMFFFNNPVQGFNSLFQHQKTLVKRLFARCKKRLFLGDDIRCGSDQIRRKPCMTPPLSFSRETYFCGTGRVQRNLVIREICRHILIFKPVEDITLLHLAAQLHIDIDNRPG